MELTFFNRNRGFYASFLTSYFNELCCGSWKNDLESAIRALSTSWFPRPNDLYGKRHLLPRFISGLFGVERLPSLPSIIPISMN